MAEIHVLDKHLAELIAAGEVVERPAAVVKELAENSIDAGATHVTIEIRNGGVSYIRVTDDGQGIEREQVAKAFLRHATSKLQTVDDLFAIGTMGFRGEALASIAAMCKVEMTTRTAEEIEGTRYSVQGGDETGCTAVGCPVGTSIIVRDIFYNTPARMKFLKRDTAEGSAVSMIVEKLALANPQIGFRLIRDGKTTLQTTGDSKLLTAIHTIYGREVSDCLMEVDYSYNGVRVRGYVSKPENSRPNRTLQNFFINSRYVKTRTAAIALEESYKNSVMTGKFPACFLNIEIAAQLVDVNVHPAKTEVRFTNERQIFECVLYGVKSAIGVGQAKPKQVSAFNPYTADKTHTEQQQQRISAEQYRASVEPATTQPVQRGKTTLPLASSHCFAELKESAPVSSVIRLAPQSPISVAKPMSILIEADPEDKLPIQGQTVAVLMQERDSPAKQVQNEAAGREQSKPLETVLEQYDIASAEQCEDAHKEQEQPDRFDGARLVGEVFAGYILLQTDTQLVFIDKHAAHERLNFNRLVDEIENNERQLLMKPVVVSLSKDIYTTAIENLQELLKLGILAEDFGEGTVVVREVPPMLMGKDIGAITEEIAFKLHSNQTDLTPDAVYDMLHSVACRKSIMVGSPSDLRELDILLTLLRQSPEVRYCPHGRPIEVSITKYELEKRFGRMG